MSSVNQWRVGVAALAALLTAPVPAQENPLAGNPAEGVDTSRIAQAPEQEPGNWLTNHGSYAAKRHSRLDQIDTGNVAGMREAWRLYLPVPHGFETTPLVVDGVMYLTTGGHTAVYAVDAGTGEELWRRRFEVPEKVPACCDWVNRGVAIGDGKVFVQTLDARLVALNAQTGDVVWETTLADWREGYTSTVAPLFVKGKVIAGISGGEYGIRGFVDAYDAATGERAWRFWTIPGPGEAGHDSWGGELPTWKTGGGPTWVTGSYDPELDLLYWTVGNPAPDFNAEVRPGDNLYTNAVVALDPDNGRLEWHYQWTPHGRWDYDGINEVVLADLEIDGQLRKTLLHADKNAHFYVIDRRDGSFIRAEPFARQTWAKELDPETGRPEVDPGALLTSAMEPLCPGPAGAKEWNHMAFSPDTGLVYIPVIENCAAFRTGQAFYKTGAPFWGSVASPEALGPGDSHGHLLAFDPVSFKPVWQSDSKWPLMSGVLSTGGGLVFWGEADGTLHAADAANGEDLWTHKAPMGMHAPPVTYAVEGKQYIAFPVGWGGWINGFAPGLREGRRGHLLLVFEIPEGGAG